MLDKHSPIGIIDSGIGGYSVARRLQNHLPHEDFLYLGDEIGRASCRERV